MLTLLLIVGSFVLYLVAYHTYGRWLGRKVFALSCRAEVPSVAHEDGKDYVPTKRGVVFGHHFTSIAGTGPIVGPALAVIWGWVPALLWVLLGSIFIGALHDFASLVVSLRNEGKTVGEIAARVIHPRARLLFLLILFLALTIVLAIFGLVIAAVFRAYPQAVLPCLLQIPLALAIGFFLHRKQYSLTLASVFCLLVMYALVWWGDQGLASEINRHLASMPIMTWVGILLAYSFVASVLPVWCLLQPRDYINSLQLLSAISLIVLGVVAAALFGLTQAEQSVPLKLAAPAFRLQPEGAPAIFPFLFVTIACGAVSGFHCLVSSGTSSKQLRSESDATFVGYGAMLTEGFLAVLVIFACVAGLGLGAKEMALDPENSKVIQTGQTLYGSDAYWNRYASWSSAKGLAEKVGAFVEGSANFLKALGLPAQFSVALMGVFVASFAATTLDTACRLQRYVIQELFGSLSDLQSNKPNWIGSLLNLGRDKYVATLLAVILGGWIASLPAVPGGSSGTGGLLLWPLFGATNQLLAGLAFLVIALWMKRQGMPLWFVIAPLLFMLVLPAWAMLHHVFSSHGFLQQGQLLLVCMGVATLVLQAWVMVEAALVWKKLQGELFGDGVDEKGDRVSGRCHTKNEGGRSC